MRYRFPPLMQSHPHKLSEMMAAGKLSHCRVWIELPDGFDFGKDKPLPSPPGLGDTVAFLAKPIAQAIDAVAGTNIVGCGKCSERQDRLNRAFPAA